MGINRLFSFIKTQPECVEHVDFVQLATNTPGGIKVLVDFYSWEHFIQSRFKLSLDQKTENPYIIFYGGEYSLIQDYMTSFVKALRSVNIELIFFLDGAKGSSDEAAARKWKTWMERQRKDCMQMRKTLKLLSGQIPFKHFDVNHLTRPCLRELQNIITLQKLGCQVHTVLSGEADTVIAQYMLQDESAVAVFTNDTDFCIFPGSVYLSDSHFDVTNDLEMVNPSLTIKKPTKLICGLVKSDRLWQHFKFPQHSCLCELAILAGNDFTLPVLNHIDDLGSFIGQISKVANIIREFGSVENFPVFLQSLMNYPELQKAVQHSRSFYSMSLPDDKAINPHDSTQSILPYSGKTHFSMKP